jgi:hypothetical protein
MVALPWNLSGVARCNPLLMHAFKWIVIGRLSRDSRVYFAVCTSTLSAELKMGLGLFDLRVLLLFIHKQAGQLRKQKEQKRLGTKMLTVKTHPLQFS